MHVCWGGGIKSFLKAPLKYIASIFENIKNNIQENKLSVASIHDLDGSLREMIIRTVKIG